MITRLLASLTVMAAGAVLADVELVRDGQAVSDIVIAEDAAQGVRLAARDLQKHVEAMSGATLPIVNAPSPDVKNRVYVGESEFTRELGFTPAAFESSGLEILAKDSHVILNGPIKHWQPSPYQIRLNTEARRYLKGSVITGKAYPRPKDFPPDSLKTWQDFCGEKFSTMHLNVARGSFNGPLKIYANDDIGPWYAVAELLEQLGVRFYMPYDIGTVIPHTKTVRVREQHLKKEAVFHKREWCYYGTMRTDDEGVAWLKRLKAGNHRIILNNHTTYAIYSSYEQQQRHPEWLVRDSKGQLVEGYPTGRGAPRYTHPTFRKAAVTFMNKVFECQPELTALTIGPPDGGVKVDPRDLAKYGSPGDSAEQKASNYVWDFHAYLASELRKSYPDKFLLYMSGAGARELPTNIDDFPDNILFRPTVSPASLWVLDTHRRMISEQNRKWLEQMKKVRRGPAWDHWLSYRTPSRPRYPVIFTKALQDQMQSVRSFVSGKFIEIQPYIKKHEDRSYTRRLGVPGLVHLMVYWQNRLFWDPDANREAMLDEYYRLFYGPAEQEMREFYEFAEEVWSRQESRSLTLDTGFLKEADVDRYFEILAAARARAGEGTIYDQRIAMIESEMQSLKKLFPGLKRTGPWVRAYTAPTPLEIDGNLNEYRYGWATLRELTTGETPRKNFTRAVITLTPDRKMLVVGAVCYENRMDDMKADCTTNDDFSVFHDDVVEVYFNTPQRSYFKIVVNPNNAVWTESTDVAIIDRDTLPILWNPAVESVVKKYDDRWVVEIKIPTDDFGELGPTKTYPWGIQVGRTRFTGGHGTAWCIAPTSGGPYRTLNKWASLWMR